MRAMLLGTFAAAAVAVAGCGSQEASVLKTAFDHPIKSANVTMSLDIASTQNPTHLTLSGPFKSNGKGTLPSLDWQLHVRGGPRGIGGEIISTGDDAFIRYGGKTYEVGRDRIRKLEAQGAQQGSLKAADLSQLMRKVRDWFPQSSTQQDAKLDGEPVTRVTGRLDLSKALKDLTQLTQNGPAITQQDLSEVDKQVTDPRFTVDVGKSDGKLRRIVATFRVREGGAVRFALRYRDIDKPVTIDAPSGGLPLSQLGRQLQHDFGG